MKYGETLPQRSISQWQIYNVDYNDIKRLIKIRTTKNQAKAVTVPGHNKESEGLQAFEDELYQELDEQHQRVELFIKSKAGELSRKLSALEAHVANLRRRYFSNADSIIPVSRLRRFSKAEEAVLSSGEELQALSRFVGAQHLAFRKLLKKYTKWTGSTELSQIFSRNVLILPSGFHNGNLNSLLRQWVAILAAVRAPFEAGIRWSAGQAGGHSSVLNDSEEALQSDQISRKRQIYNSSSADLGPPSDIVRSLQDENPASFDTAFSMDPLSSGETVASYWIHNDNLLQLQVLLLKYTGLQFSKKPSPHPSSSSSCHPLEASDSCFSIANVNNHSQMIICGNADQVVSRTSALKNRSLKHNSEQAIPGHFTTVSIPNLLQLQKVIRDHEYPNTGAIPQSRHPMSGKDLSRTILKYLQDQAPVSTRHLAQGPDFPSNMAPLAVVRQQRQRFSGFQNDAHSHVFATLDHNISYEKVHTNAKAVNIDVGGKLSETFAHAVLTLRFRGQGPQSLIDALEETHLTRKVHGFTMEKHTITSTYADKGEDRLPWAHLLRQDIRTLPPSHGSRNQSPGKKLFQSIGARPEQSSNSAPSTDACPQCTLTPYDATLSVPVTPESLTSPRSVIRHQRKQPSNPKVSHNPTAVDSTPAPTRYWNEFDDGDESEEQEGYYIYVESKPSTLAGLGFLEAGVAKLSAALQRSLATVSRIRDNTTKKLSPDSEPLIRDVAIDSSEDDTDLEQSVIRSQGHRFKQREYSTFLRSSAGHRSISDARIRIIPWILFLSFILSTVLLMIAVIMSSQRRNAAHRFRQDESRDFGILVCNAASLLIAFAGLTTVLAANTQLRLVIKLAFLVLTWLMILGNCLVAAIVW